MGRTRICNQNRWPPMKKKIEHTTIRNGALFCMNCGTAEPLAIPMRIDTMTAKFRAFNKTHANCPPTWKPAEPDFSLGEMERVNWWLQNGERGASSEAIVTVCYRIKVTVGLHYHHPHDPDDFRRCYLLLKAVPELLNPDCSLPGEIRPRFKAMRNVSSAWANLVDNWQVLTEMFERRDDKMFELMQTLINEKETQAPTSPA